MRIIVTISAVALLLAGCSQTTKLGAGADALIGKNFATFQIAPSNLSRSIQTTQVLTGNFFLDVTVNAIGAAARQSGNTARKTKRILPPSFDPGQRVAQNISNYMQSQYKVVLQPDVPNTVGPAKPAGNWPDKERVEKIAFSARQQGFDGVVLDFDTTGFSAESTGNSLNRGGGNVELVYSGRFAFIESRTGKVLSAGHCNTRPNGTVKLDNLLARGPIAATASPVVNPGLTSQTQSHSTTTVTTTTTSGTTTTTTGSQVSSTPLVDGNIGALQHAQIEPNQSYVDGLYNQMTTKCVNDIIKKALS